VLIKLLTLIYILTYFCNVICLLYQLIVYAFFEANFWKRFFFLQIFLQFQIFNVKHSDESSLAVRCPSSSRSDG
jgi:hypothetical protein